MQTMAEKGIYVHVPFCARKCQYCDFHSVVADETFVGSYFDAFEQELLVRSREAAADSFDTLFIGGGTPSILTISRLDRLLRMLTSSFTFSSGAEITVEVNPSSLSLAKLRCLRSWGVNRLSMGVQSFEPHLLEALGRLHTVEQVFQSLRSARQVGFDNISMDLMFGLPDQTMAQWQATLATAVQLGIQHLSAYALILEEATPFYRWAQQGLLALPDEDTEACMFETTMQYLPDHGMPQYEISNYARLGCESQHNMLYWTGKPYLALGSGAAGYWRGRRYVNTKDMALYVSGWQNHAATETLELEEFPNRYQQMDEYMMTGMRLLRGIHGPTFAKRFGMAISEAYPAQLQRLLERNLVQWTADGYLQLTYAGRVLGNHVFSAWLR